MRTYRSKLLMLIAALSLFSCLPKKETPFNVTYNILQEFQLSIREETQLIDFRKQAAPEQYLLRGWAPSGEQFTWATARESRLLFYRYDISNDMEVEIRCRTLPSKEKISQNIQVLLNEKEADSFTVQPGEFQTFSLTLPASLLRTGQNILGFRFSYTTQPRDVYPHVQDKRNLAVAFQTIRMNHNTHLRYIENSGLLQQADSAFSVFSELPDKFEFDVQYQNLHNTVSYIEVISQNGKKRSLKLSPKKTAYRKTISLKKPGIYKLQFVTKGPPGKYVIWSKISIHSYQPQNPSLQKEHGFSRVTKPDIVIYVSDALRADHLGCYGYHRNTSPNIDRFAQKNTFFQNAYANAAWTRPSGASILTGLYPKHHSALKREDRLPDALVTLAETLQEQGYYTIAFMGNGILSHVFGFQQGFLKFKEFFRRYPVTHHVQASTIHKKVITFLNTYLQRKPRKPLFMLIWTVDPHAPYAPVEDVQEMFDISQYSPIDTYDAELLLKIRSGKIYPTPSQIEYMKTRYDQEIYMNDRAFGELLNAMREFGIYKNAVVIFTADHGEEFFEHGGVGHGQTLYNELVKVPMIIKAKDIEPGEHEEYVQHVDIYPTVLDILGLAPPYKLDGISLLSPIPSDRPLYFEETRPQTHGHDLKAIVDHGKKLIFNREAKRPPLTQAIPVFELYAIEDSLEQKNLPLSSFEDGFRLQKLLVYWNKKSTFDVQQTGVDIPQKLHEQLKDLGYVK